MCFLPETERFRSNSGELPTSICAFYDIACQKLGWIGTWGHYSPHVGVFWQSADLNWQSGCGSMIVTLWKNEMHKNLTQSTAQAQL